MSSKMVIGFESFPDFSDNSLALYNYMLENCQDKYDLLWIKNRATSPPDSNTRFIDREDENFIKKFNNINIIFSTHNLCMNFKNDKQVLFCLWHGLGGPKAMGNLLGTKEARDWVDMFTEKTDYMISGSRLVSFFYCYELGLPFNRLLEFGQPRTDIILSCEPRKKLKSILGDVDKYKKIIFYLPTFREGLGKKEGALNRNNVINLRLYKEADLNEYLKKNGYLLICKSHPSESNKFRNNSFSNIKILDEKSMINTSVSLYHIIGASDLLVTDYSSVYIDYLLINKPILFIHTDYSKYIGDRGLVYNDMDLWFPGPRINSIKEFFVETKKLILDKDYFYEERQRTNEKININQGFSSCSKIVDFIGKNEAELVNKVPVDLISFKISQNKELSVKNDNLNIQNKELSVKNDNLNIQNKELSVKNDNLNSILNLRSVVVVLKFRSVFLRIIKFLSR